MRIFTEGKLRFDQSGITLIELMIVITIMGLISAFSIGIVGNLLYSTQLDNSEEMIVQFLKTARERSFARLNNASHGVYFDINSGGDDQVILFQGDTYLSRDGDYDRVLEVSGSIEISTTLPNNEVVFSKGNGRPDSEGAVTVRHIEKNLKIITINSHGLIEGN